MKAVLKTVEENAILGFEYIKEWRVLECDEHYLVIKGVDRGSDPPVFTLVNSSFVKEERLPANYFFIVSYVDDNKVVLNTRAPVVVDGSQISQILRGARLGRVIEEVDRKTGRKIA